METAEASEGAESPQFYKVPLSPQCVHYVDSAESEAFSLLLWALRNSSVIAMDAEWKPVFNASPGSGNPRVSIFQLACRLRDGRGTRKSIVGRSQSSPRERNEEYREFRERTTLDTETLSNQDDNETEPESAGEDYCNGLGPGQIESFELDTHKKLEEQGGDISIRSRNGESERKGELKAHRRNGEEVSEEGMIGEGTSRRELIFVLDLLAVPADAFTETSHCCFDKVDPYLDVGKLYKHLHKNASSFMHRGKRISVGGDGLASIVEAVLGVPLSKDMQCSNWEQRPLSPQQYDYAAADAYCLLALFDSLLSKTSDSWFTPVEEEDELEEDDGPICESRSKVGVAELLCLQSSFTPRVGCSSGESATIYQSRRGNAVNMVVAAVGLSNVKSVKEQDGYDGLEHATRENRILGVEKLVSRFGETLVMSGSECSSKRVKRKARSRRARVAKSKDQQDEEDDQWVGPPPWDSSVGGDEVPKFLCDAMVEGLARQLRCVGIDAASLNSKKCEPRELVELAEKEGRILLTRDVKLLRRRLVPENLAYRVKRQGKWQQLSEIIRIFHLSISEEQLLTRCTKCNGDFVPEALTGEEAVARAPWSQVIPACALQNVEEFWQCSVCKHVYWQHWD
ncbi:hypothetical protein R1flu_002548 [Riccia fluitans]|uniref:3'-5' exonuclease domain-containing protein n=1 Tax=Riccia fluitans TaxID=41844 RepID=A0ABD1Y6E7_9MARC